MGCYTHQLRERLNNGTVHWLAAVLLVAGPLALG